MEKKEKKVKFCLFIQDEERETLIVTPEEKDARKMAEKYHTDYWMEDADRTVEEIFAEVRANL